ncbi:MAG: hypothetical protein ABIA04_12100 [Pseudomonadota bacterium]
MKFLKYLGVILNITCAIPVVFFLTVGGELITVYQYVGSVFLFFFLGLNIFLILFLPSSGMKPVSSDNKKQQN